MLRMYVPETMHGNCMILKPRFGTGIWLWISTQCSRIIVKLGKQSWNLTFHLHICFSHMKISLYSFTRSAEGMEGARAKVSFWTKACETLAWQDQMSSLSNTCFQSLEDTNSMVFAASSSHIIAMTLTSGVLDFFSLQFNCKWVLKMGKEMSVRGLQITISYPEVFTRGVSPGCKTNQKQNHANG